MHTGFGADCPTIPRDGLWFTHREADWAPIRASKWQEPRKNSWSAALFETNTNLQILRFLWRGCPLSWNLQVGKIWKIKELWSQTSLILYNQVLVESPTTRNTWTYLPFWLLLLFQLFKIWKFDLTAISPRSDPQYLLCGTPWCSRTRRSFVGPRF